MQRAACASHYSPALRAVCAPPSHYIPPNEDPSRSHGGRARMPLVPVLRGPAPSAALTSFPSSSFRDYPPGCALSRPFAQTNSFFLFPPTPRPARSSFISLSGTLGRPAGAAFADGPGRPINIHSCRHFLSRPAGTPTLPSAPPPYPPACLPPAPRGGTRSSRGPQGAPAAGRAGLAAPASAPCPPRS